MKKLINFILFLSVVALAFFLRTYNLNWDAGTHIHPDERFLTMVTNDLRLPNSFADYLNPRVSSMNPHNMNYGFFVYGTFPIYLVKILALWLKMDNYGNITILGRFVSAVFDTGIVIILFFLTKKLLLDQKSKIKNPLLIFVPSLLYTLIVLPIQLSHFFAVDTSLAFFMIASVYFSILIDGYIVARKWKKVILFSLLTGIATGLGLACKVTMLFIVPLNFLIVFLPFMSFQMRRSTSVWNLKYFKIPVGVYLARKCGTGMIIMIVAYLAFRLAQPMAFSDGNLFNFSLNPKWIKNLTDLQTMNSSSLSNTYPPAIQWFTTQPILFPLVNMILWGMGIPMGLLCLTALIFNFKFLIFKIYKEKSLISLISPISFLFIFSIVFFLYQSSQFTKTMRYIYPVYWAFALISGFFIVKIFQALSLRQRETCGCVSTKKYILIPLTFFIFLFSLLVYPLAFLQIYTRPYTRVAASHWIYQNIPRGAKVTFEEWDDPLPLLIDGHGGNEYPGLALPMFWPDSAEKWQLVNARLAQADYLILSSNRIYGSVPRRPDIYPQTIKFYENLFAEKLGFKKVAEFESRPTIPFLNYEFIDDAADESWTVYDHPKVKIFKKMNY